MQIAVLGVAHPTTAAEVRALAIQARQRREEWFRRPDIAVPIEPIDKPAPEPAPKLELFDIFGKSNAPKLRATPPTITEIQIAVLGYFNRQRRRLTMNDMVGQSRHKQFTYPRHLIMYLAKTMTHKSMREIARRLGNRDHTTILSGYKQIGRFCKGSFYQQRPCPLFDVLGIKELLRSQMAGTDDQNKTCQS